MNVAFMKPSSQVSTLITENFPYGNASKAVDGLPWTHAINEGTCTHTENANQPWWSVDLGDMMVIAAVIIYSRMDGKTNTLSQS